MSQTNRNDASRLWVQKNLNKLAINRALERIQSTGRALPCKVQAMSGQIVTVTFDVQSDVWTLPPVTIPVATDVYDWIPVQVGDPGITMPCDVSIGPISGLGGNQAVLGETVGNLSSLMFVPVSDAAWTAPGGDPDKRVMQGPSGFITQIMGGATSIVGDANGITFTAGGITMILNSSGLTINGNLVVAGNISGGTGSGGGTAAFNGNISTTGDIKTGSLSSIDSHVHLYSPGSGSPTDTGTPTG